MLAVLKISPNVMTTKLDIYKKSLTVRPMKHTTTKKKLRSIFTSGAKMGHQIHRTKKGPGSYRRNNRITD